MQVKVHFAFSLLKVLTYLISSYESKHKMWTYDRTTNKQTNKQRTKRKDGTGLIHYIGLTSVFHAEKSEKLKRTVQYTK